MIEKNWFEEKEEQLVLRNAELQRSSSKERGIRDESNFRISIF